ncbi:3D domain-containing protein [soil metagenome]
MRRHGRLAALALCFAFGALAPSARAAPSTDSIGDLLNEVLQTSQAVAVQITATLYHGGAPGIRSRDSLGCLVSPMRTLAVDPRVIPKHSIVFIAETVGMILPNGQVHDGLWYASDVGGAIKGQRVDLFTGSGRISMSQFLQKGLNLGKITAKTVGTFKGCPPQD